MWALKERMGLDWLQASDFKSESQPGRITVWGTKANRIVFGTLQMAKTMQKLFNTLEDGTDDHYLKIIRVKA